MTLWSAHFRVGVALSYMNRQCKSLAEGLERSLLFAIRSHSTYLHRNSSIYPFLLPLGHNRTLIKAMALFPQVPLINSLI